MNTDTGTGTGTGRTGTWSRAGGGETVTRRSGARTSVVGSAVSGTRRALGAAGRGVAAAGRWLAETMTPAGWLVTGVLIVGLVAAIGFGILEAWVVAVITAVLLIVAIPFLLGALKLDLHLQLERDRVVAGSSIGGVLHVRNASTRIALPSVIDVPVGDGLVETHVPLLMPGATHAAQLTIAAARRGIIMVGPMTVTRGDPIGLLRRDLAWPQVEEICVHPVTVPIPATSAGFIRDVEGTITRTIVDQDLAFHAIRAYVPGDSRRHVHWKSTAKTGELMVRQYEETRRARIAIVLDLGRDHYADDDEFEMAVSAAASLAVQGIRDGREVLVAVAGGRGADGSLTIRTLPTLSPRALLDATSRIDSSPTALRIDEVTALTAQSYPDLSIAFIVSGTALSAEQERRAAFGFPTDVRSVVVRCEDSAEPKARAARDYIRLTIGAIGDLGQLIARGAVDS